MGSRELASVGADGSAQSGDDNGDGIIEIGPTYRGVMYELTLAAPGAAYLPTQSTGPLNYTGPFTEYVPPRTVRIVAGTGTTNPTHFTVTGRTYEGATIVDSITATGAGAFDGHKAMASITSTSRCDTADSTSTHSCAFDGK